MELAHNDGALAFLYPPCFYCKHIVEIGDQEGEEGWTCNAFPDGIPYRILQRYRDHLSEWPRQEGDYTYESKIFTYEDKHGLIKERRVTFDGTWVEV